jgi:hypothetical protein
MHHHTLKALRWTLYPLACLASQPERAASRGWLWFRRGYYALEIAIAGERAMLNRRGYHHIYVVGNNHTALR